MQLRSLREQCACCTFDICGGLFFFSMLGEEWVSQNAFTHSGLRCQLALHSYFPRRDYFVSRQHFIVGTSLTSSADGSVITLFRDNAKNTSLQMHRLLDALKQCDTT